MPWLLSKSGGKRKFTWERLTAALAAVNAGTQTRYDTSSLYTTIPGLWGRPKTGGPPTPTVTTTAGTPGTFTGPVPANFAALQALGALGNTAAWTVGQNVVLGNASTAYWNGAAWVAGIAPRAKPAVGTAADWTGTTPEPAMSPGQVGLWSADVSAKMDCNNLPLVVNTPQTFTVTLSDGSTKTLTLPAGTYPHIGFPPRNPPKPAAGTYGWAGAGAEIPATPGMIGQWIDVTGVFGSTTFPMTLAAPVRVNVEMNDGSVLFVDFPAKRYPDPAMTDGGGAAGINSLGYQAFYDGLPAPLDSMTPVVDGGKLYMRVDVPDTSASWPVKPWGNTPGGAIVGDPAFPDELAGVSIGVDGTHTYLRVDAFFDHAAAVAQFAAWGAGTPPAVAGTVYPVSVT